MEILSSILKERSSNYLLGIYTAASTVILALCGSLVSRMLYEEVEMEVKIITVNDQLGHPMGDKVLKDTADIKYPILIQREFHIMQ